MAGSWSVLEVVVDSLSSRHPEKSNWSHKEAGKEHVSEVIKCQEDGCMTMILVSPGLHSQKPNRQ